MRAAPIEMEHTVMELRTIDKENFWDIVELKVAAGQEGFVAPNAVSIAQAQFYPGNRSLAAYVQGQPVGYTFFGLDDDDHEYWLARLMVDEEHQGKGYGRQILQWVLKTTREDGRCCIYLGVEPENAAAIALYKSEGFEFDGRVFGKEHVMIKRFEA